MLQPDSLCLQGEAAEGKVRSRAEGAGELRESCCGETAGAEKEAAGDGGAAGPPADFVQATRSRDGRRQTGTRLVWPFRRLFPPSAKQLVPTELSPQTRDKLAEERCSLTEVIRQEFAERLVAAEEENRRLKLEVSEVRARLRLEVDRIHQEKEEELAEVHQR